MRRLGSPLAFLAVLAAVLLPAASASGLSYPVTSKADTGDKGTLRGSIEEANAHSGADSIPIEVTGTIFLVNALPAVDGDLAIVGPGSQSLTLGRSPLAGSFRILTFSTGNVSLEGLEITEGDYAPGGGIYNGTGSLILARVAVVGNEARSESMLDAPARGGGIYSLGPLTLRESVVSGNRAIAAEGSGETDADGGGIYASGQLTIDRSTISGNSVLAEEGTEASPAGGGVFALGGGQLTGVTVTSNSAAGEGATGSNLRLPGNLTLRDTIVADPRGTAESCSGVADSGGYNLDEDGSCGVDQGSDLVGVTAGLDPVLRDNGGPTPTHAILPGSIAVDRGNSFGSTTDQRGLPRPSDFPAISNKEGGDGSDIGAFELQVPPPGPGPVLVTQVPSDRQPPNTRIVKGPARDSYERQAKFRFASTEAQSSFQCKVDKSRWRGCHNPYKRTVTPGKHVFKVRAIDRFGNVDPTPARFGWRVKPLS
jgi:hypothetical protein